MLSYKEFSANLIARSMQSIVTFSDFCNHHIHWLLHLVTHKGWPVLGFPQIDLPRDILVKGSKCEI